VPLRVVPAVASAAIASGAARHPIDEAAYAEDLANRLTPGHEVMGVVIHKAQAAAKRIVFSEGEDLKVIRAAAGIQ
jgi:malate dehydrogenase (oxaloacetate-decarboxylating)(NADP+)